MGQGVAMPEREKSHRCNGCLKFDCHMELLQCSACQSVHYCSVQCQKAHWPKHKVLCKAIKELPAKGACKEKGLETSKMRVCLQATSLPGNKSALPNLWEEIFNAVLPE